LVRQESKEAEMANQYKRRDPEDRNVWYWAAGVVVIILLIGVIAGYNPGSDYNTGYNAPTGTTAPAPATPAPAANGNP
jgi:hypothetical protein